MTKNLKIGIVLLVLLMVFLIWDSGMFGDNDTENTQANILPPPVALPEPEYRAKTVQDNQESLNRSPESERLRKLQVDLLESQYIAQTTKNKTDKDLAVISVEKARQELEIEQMRIENEMKLSHNQTAASMYGYGSHPQQTAVASSEKPAPMRIILNAILSDSAIISINDDAITLRPGETANGVRLESIRSNRNQVVIVNHQGSKQTLGLLNMSARSSTHISPLVKSEGVQ